MEYVEYLSSTWRNTYRNVKPPRVVPSHQYCSHRQNQDQVRRCLVDVDTEVGTLRLAALFDNRNPAHTRRRVVTVAEEGEAAKDPMGPVVVWRDCYGKSGSDKRHPDERRIRS